MRGDPAEERGTLTREQVVRAALALLDEVGLDGLSMRSLADRLGVKAASLYWHLRDKDQLLGLLAEAILAEVPEPPDGAWRPALDAFASGYRTVLLAHRDAARVVAGLQTGPAALRLYERLLAILLDAGFTADDAADAAALLLGQTVPAFVSVEAAAPELAAAEPGGADFNAPLAGVELGRLTLSGGASRLSIRSDPGLRDLYAAHFRGRVRVRAEDGAVEIGGHGRGGPRSGEVVLNGGIAWNVEVAGGVSNVSAELESVRLGAFVVNGGAHQATLRLGPPLGTVPVTFNGGVSRVAVVRPAGTPVRVRVTSGASRLAMDDLRFGSVGGETRWQTPDFAAAEDRYDVEVHGGASRLTIGTTLGEAADVEAAFPAAGQVVAPLEGVSAEEHPHVAAVAGRLADPDPDERFRFCLDVLLGGLERRLGR